MVGCSPLWVAALGAGAGGLPLTVLADAASGWAAGAFTYTRTGTILLRQQNGSLQSFASDTLGSYWDGTRKLYRVDPGYTQSFLQSHMISAGSWTKTNLNTPTQSATGVNGSTDSWAITETTANGEHGLSQAVSYTSGVYYTMQVVAAPRAGSTRYLTLVFPSTTFTSNAIATFDLATGAISANGTILASSAVQLANGHWLCTCTALATATTSGTTLARVSNVSTSAAIPSYTGDGSSGINIWCLNVTNTAYPAPLSTATITAVNIGAPSWTGLLSSLGMTLSGDFSIGVDYVADVMVGTLPTRTPMQVDKGNNNDRACIRALVANAPRGTIAAASSTTYNQAASGNDGTLVKAALRVAAADSKICANGALGTGSGAISIPSALTTLRVGNDSNTNYLVGGISRLWLSASALSDVQLQAATA